MVEMTITSKRKAGEKDFYYSEDSGNRGFVDRFLDSEESKNSQRLYRTNLELLEPGFAEALDKCMRLVELIKELIEVFSIKHPKVVIPKHIIDDWIATSKSLLLGEKPKKRGKGCDEERTQVSLDYSRRGKKIYSTFYYVIKVYHKRQCGFSWNRKKAKGGHMDEDDLSFASLTGSTDPIVSEEELSEEEGEGEEKITEEMLREVQVGNSSGVARQQEEGADEGRSAPQQSFCGGLTSAAGRTHIGGGSLHRRAESGTENDESDGESDCTYQEIGKETETGSKDKGEKVMSTEKEKKQTKSKSHRAESGHERTKARKDEEEESGSEEDDKEDDKEHGRPRRVVSQMMRLTYSRPEKETPARSRRRSTSAAIREPSPPAMPNQESIGDATHLMDEQGVRVPHSLQWTHLRNVGVYVEASRHGEELPPLKDDVINTFGISNTKTSASQSFSQPQSQQNTKFSSCPSITLHGSPKGAVCRVIRNVNEGVLHVEVFPQSIHFFDTLSVVGCHIADMPTEEVEEFVSRATENLQPVFARRYNLDHGDIIFVDARMLVRVTESALTSTHDKIVFEQCVVSLFANHLSVDDLAFNYPDECSPMELYFKRNILVEKAVLQYLFPTWNMASAVLSLISSPNLKSVCKDMDKKVKSFTILQRLQHLDVVGNFREAEALRRNCLKSLSLDKNSSFKNLSVWDIRILVLASLHAKSTFFAEVLLFDRMPNDLQDAVKHLCRLSTQTCAFPVQTVKISDLLSFSSSSAVASVREFLEHLKVESGNEGYVTLEENDKSNLPAGVIANLGEYYSTSITQTSCRCASRCDENCTTRLAHCLCTRLCCKLAAASPQSKCGNTIADLLVSDVVVRDCDDYLMGKELTAGSSGFRKGDFVAQYIGELIARNQALSGRNLRYTILCDMKSSSVEWPDYVYINAERKGNISRRANHSHNPNCHVFIWFESECPIALIFARREINPGEAITFDYKWEEPGCFGERGCMCNSELCPNKDPSKGKSYLEMLLMTSCKNELQTLTCQLSMVPGSKNPRSQRQVVAAPEAGQTQRYLFIVHMNSYFV